MAAVRSCRGGKPVTAPDDLLRWASETGRGSWRHLRDAAAYLARTHALDVRPWQLAVPLTSLGHLDIDWQEQRWSVAAPAVALSPGMGLCAYLVGARPSRMLERFDEATEDLRVYPFRLKQRNAPAALFAKCSSAAVTEDVAHRLGVPLIFEPASGIVEELPNVVLDEASRSSPIPIEDGLERFDPIDGRWRQVTGRDEEGLYRLDLYGRRMHGLRRGDDWYSVDKATGQLLVLEGQSDRLFWCRPSSDFRVPSTLEVVEWLGLPPLAQRAAVASSGLVPVLSGNRRIYRNVTRSTATTIAERLGLPLTVEHKPSTRLSRHPSRSL